MTPEEFRSVSGQPLSSFSNNLQAMWYDAHGDWKKAHDLAQEIHNEDGAWIHAYLHRKEGDDGNAAYWYQRAKRKMPTYHLDKEWDEITAYFLKNAG